jgi:hypothetical protein
MQAVCGAGLDDGGVSRASNSAANEAIDQTPFQIKAETTRILPCVVTAAPEASLATTPRASASAELQAQAQQQHCTISLSDLQCPICCEVFTSPVVLPTGMTFCRECISGWLQQNSTCPITRAPASIRQLSPCFALEGILNALGYPQPAQAQPNLQPHTQSDQQQYELQQQQDSASILALVHELCSTLQRDRMPALQQLFRLLHSGRGSSASMHWLMPMSSSSSSSSSSSTAGPAMGSSLVHAAAEELLQAGGVEALVSLLSSSQPADVQCAAAKVLLLACKSSAGCRTAAGQAGMADFAQRMASNAGAWQQQAFAMELIAVSLAAGLDQQQQSQHNNASLGGMLGPAGVRLPQLVAVSVADGAQQQQQGHQQLAARSAALAAKHLAQSSSSRALQLSAARLMAHSIAAQGAWPCAAAMRQADGAAAGLAHMLKHGALPELLVAGQVAAALAAVDSELRRRLTCRAEVLGAVARQLVAAGASGDGLVQQHAFEEECQAVAAELDGFSMHHSLSSVPAAGGAAANAAGTAAGGEGTVIDPGSTAAGPAGISTGPAGQVSAEPFNLSCMEVAALLLSVLVRSATSAGIKVLTPALQPLAWMAARVRISSSALHTAPGVSPAEQVLLAVAKRGHRSAAKQAVRQVLYAGPDSQAVKVACRKLFMALNETSMRHLLSSMLLP